MEPTITEYITDISTSIIPVWMDRIPTIQNRIAAMNVVFLSATAGSFMFFIAAMEKTPTMDAKYPTRPRKIGMIT